MVRLHSIVLAGVEVGLWRRVKLQEILLELLGSFKVDDSVDCSWTMDLVGV